MQAEMVQSRLESGGDFWGVETVRYFREPPNDLSQDLCGNQGRTAGTKI